jgi:hypothetical protein
VQAPQGDSALEAGDELLFVAIADQERALQDLLAPHRHT